MEGHMERAAAEKAEMAATIDELRATMDQVGDTALCTVVYSRVQLVQCCQRPLL
jgi:hypothetical protein